MKDSYEEFLQWVGSNESLMDYVRIHAEWNEDSFLQMQRLAREVMKTYAAKDYYPKHFVAYFMCEIPMIINILSQFRHCSEKERIAGYTDECYLGMIADRIEQLKKFQQEFMYSLGDLQ